MNFFFNFAEKVDISNGERFRDNYGFIRGIFPWRSKKKRKYSNVMGYGVECTSISMENDGYLAVAATNKEKSLEHHTERNTGWELRHISFRVFILAICMLILGLVTWGMYHYEALGTSRAGLGVDESKYDAKIMLRSFRRQIKI